MDNSHVKAPVLCYLMRTLRPLEYERVYMSLYKVADTPFHIQGDDFSIGIPI